MDQQRLFFVAPDAIHLALYHEPLGHQWRLTVGVARRGRDGDLRVSREEAYEALCSAEAHDVVAAVLHHLLGL
jgi:hypothetical protein